MVCLCFVCRFAAHEFQKPPGSLFRGFRRAAGAKIFEFWGAPGYYLGPNGVTVYCMMGGWGVPGGLRQLTTFDRDNQLFYC